MRDAQAAAAQEAIDDSGCQITGLDADLDQLLRLAAHLAGLVDRTWETLGADEKLVWLKIAHHTVIRCFADATSTTVVPRQESPVRVRNRVRS